MQALSPLKYRLKFCYSSDWYAANINRIPFRSIKLTPLAAYEEVKSMFVDRALLQMQDNVLFETLAPYGRVISIQHLKVKGFKSVCSGTHEVSMVPTKAIPANINIGGFSVSFLYRGQLATCFMCQEVGHVGKCCPKSWRAKKLLKSKQEGTHNNTSGHADLKIHLEGSERTIYPSCVKGVKVGVKAAMIEPSAEAAPSAP